MKTRQRLKILRQTDEGFSIIEVLAAFSVLAIVTIGTVPLFISGLRASLVAKMDTQAKNLAQERLDIMRNLPFHLELTDQAEAPAPANCTPPGRTDPRTGGSVVCSYRDLMDTYYRSTTAATSATTGGYVAVGAARIADEPDNAFYRFVIDPVPGFDNRFRQVVATQFLDVNRVSAAPAADYNTQVVAKDFPKTRLVGVTIITTWKAGQIGKKFVNFTQMSESRVPPSAVVLQSRTIALRITGNIDLTRQLKMEVGSANADGAISAGGSGATQVNSAVAEVFPPFTPPSASRIDGASESAAAPPTTVKADAGAGPPTPLAVGGVTIAQFSNTKVRNVAVTISADQPIVGNGTPGAPPLNPALARLTGSGPSPKLGFHNLPDAAPLSPMPQLRTDLMIVRMNEASNDDSKTLIEGSTYARSVGGSSHKAIAGSGAFTDVVKIAPTTFAPDGVVQVELSEASLSCEAGGATSSAVADFTATIKVWTYDVASSGLNSGYTTVRTVTEGQLVSPLDVATLATQVGRDALLQPIFLSQYIASWGSPTGPAATAGSTSDAVQRAINGIVTISTKPVRLSDPDSNIGITLGLLSCQTEDHR